VNAYLPSGLINPPADIDANYYYPYKSEPGMIPAPKNVSPLNGFAGLPRMSVIGNVPLFTDEKRGYYGSEKV
jgi:hypothetical protein